MIVMAEVLNERVRGPELDRLLGEGTLTTRILILPDGLKCVAKRYLTSP